MTDTKGKSRGQHPYSDYMISDGDEIYNLTTLDIVVDIAGVFLPLRSINYKKTMNIGDEYGSGSLDPFALPNKEQAYTGTFTYASFLVNGVPAMTTHDKLLFEQLLQDQSDEGRSIYFDIYMMEVPPHNNGNADARTVITGLNSSAQPTSQLSASIGSLGFIEALINCKVTELSRDFPDKDTIVTQRSFKYMRKIPA